MTARELQPIRAPAEQRYHLDRIKYEKLSMQVLRMQLTWVMHCWLGLQLLLGARHMVPWSGCIHKMWETVPEMEGVRARPEAGRKAPAANGRAMIL